MAIATVNQYGIALRPGPDSKASIGFLPDPGDSIEISPHWAELFLEGYSRLVETRFLKVADFSGLIDPSSLLNRRITVDVEINGAVEIDCIPAPTRLARIVSLFRKRKRPSPPFEYHCNLPWTNLSVKGASGKCYPLTVNVDTGSNGELSLPPTLVERLGLRLLDRCRLRTPNGQGEYRCGEVEILWRDKSCTVECIEREDFVPPLIGTKLLRGERITIDNHVDYEPPLVRISPIPRREKSARM